MFRDVGYTPTTLQMIVDVWLHGHGILTLVSEFVPLPSDGELEEHPHSCGADARDFASSWSEVVV